MLELIATCWLHETPPTMATILNQLSDNITETELQERKSAAGNLELIIEIFRYINRFSEASNDDSCLAVQSGYRKY